ncbi:putative nitrite oxidoreductase, membrane subunit [Nitrospira sp. KM1]|uniref:ethylbenzene dehydrogenase-related protein n=1 Tax=Nitrospira sp. KM1 TaxID=1936990 RepID=UPI0013A77FA3|nr:ethylbenzene dehydrogenase-related protein [Nitrospira sp. KM1]BCA55944.1 putative nitrite oxidoreductase, membrane subunit [Nitrospira sp. KM1]
MTRVKPRPVTTFKIASAGAAFACLLAGAVPVLAQESVAVRAPLAKGALPVDDPNAAAWSSAPQAQFPMSPQVHWQNRIQEVTVKDVKVRALHDGTQVAFLLEYEDPTEDPDDAAALEFMVGELKAHFAHGQPMSQVEGGPVNIWFWKNKANKAVDMNAKGFGTLKTQSHQDVTAKGVYSNGTWKVVFSRALSNEHVDEDTQVKPGEFINIAFAVWDGKKNGAGELQEKGSQKAVSSWWYFRAEPPPDYSGYLYAAMAIAVAVGFQFVLIRKLKKGQSA